MAGVQADQKDEQGDRGFAYNYSENIGSFADYTSFAVAAVSAFDTCTVAGNKMRPFAAVGVGVVGVVGVVGAAVKNFSEHHMNNHLASWQEDLEGTFGAVMLEDGIQEWSYEDERRTASAALQERRPYEGKTAGERLAFHSNPFDSPFVLLEPGAWEVACKDIPEFQSGKESVEMHLRAAESQPWASH